jgi:hypothetical protein
MGFNSPLEELNILQCLWLYGECLLCRVLLPVEYSCNHTLFRGKSERHKIHSTVPLTLYYNKKISEHTMLGPWSILIDIQHQGYVRILACSDSYQSSTVVPRPRNDPVQESGALYVFQGVNNTSTPSPCFTPNLCTWKLGVNQIWHSCQKETNREELA